MQKKLKTEQAAWRELYVSCQGRFKHTHFWTKKAKKRRVSRDDLPLLS